MISEAGILRRTAAFMPTLPIGPGPRTNVAAALRLIGENLQAGLDRPGDGARC